MSICILGFVFSLRTTFDVLLEPTVFRVVATSSTVPIFNQVLVLVLALVPVLSVLSLLSLLSFAFALSVLAFALLALAFAKWDQCPLCRLLLGVMDLSVSRFVLRDLYTHSMF